MGWLAWLIFVVWRAGVRYRVIPCLVATAVWALTLLPATTANQPVVDVVMIQRTGRFLWMIKVKVVRCCCRSIYPDIEATSYLCALFLRALPSPEVN